MIYGSQKFLVYRLKEFLNDSYFLNNSKVLSIEFTFQGFIIVSHVLCTISLISFKQKSGIHVH